MSNFWGKTLLEAKRVGTTISKSAKEVGSAIGQATANVADHTKKSAKIAMLKAEMDQMYTKLGKAVFNYGMIEENEEALNIMKEMLNKKQEIEILEKELDECDCEHDHECGHEGPCDCECDCEDCDNDCDCENCGDDCDCGCHDENPQPKEAREESQVDNAEEDEIPCTCDEDKKTEE